MRAWFRVRAGGLVSNFSQVRFWLRACGEGGELCVGERRLCNGLFRFGLRILLAFYPHFCRVVGAASCQTILASTHDATRLNDIHLR